MTIKEVPVSSQGEEVSQGNFDWGAVWQSALCESAPQQDIQDTIQFLESHNIDTSQYGFVTVVTALLATGDTAQGMLSAILGEGVGCNI